MKHFGDGVLFFTGLFLMSCDNVIVVLVGLGSMTLGAYVSGALPIGRRRAKEKKWR